MFCFSRKKTPVLRFTLFFLLIEELFNLTVGFQIKKNVLIFQNEVLEIVNMICPTLRYNVLIQK